MKYIVYFLLPIALISGCYTMLNHPEVEIYYERENGEEYLTEEYDVFVDEDCTSCHEAFLPQKHFSPMIPAHNLSSNWNDLPWWLDNKYLMFFSDDRDSTSDNDINSGYQYSNSQRRNNSSINQQSGYVPSSGTSSTSSKGSSAGNSVNTTKAQKANEGSSTSSVSSQRSEKNSSNSKNNGSKRKFRKRR